MERVLFHEYKKGRKDVKNMKQWWFNTRAKQLIKQHDSGQDLKCSDHWFARFC